jgi:hypothetical protein
MGARPRITDGLLKSSGKSQAISAEQHRELVGWAMESEQALQGLTKTYTLSTTPELFRRWLAAYCLKRWPIGCQVPGGRIDLLKPRLFFTDPDSGVAYVHIGGHYTRVYPSGNERVFTILGETNPPISRLTFALSEINPYSTKVDVTCTCSYLAPFYLELIEAIESEQGFGLRTEHSLLSSANPGGAPTGKRPASIERDKELQRLYDKGLNDGQIARQLHITADYVAKLRKAQGLPSKHSTNKKGGRNI